MEQLTTPNILPILTLTLGALGGFASKCALDHLAYRREGTRQRSAYKRDILMNLQDSQLSRLYEVSTQRWEVIRQINRLDKPNAEYSPQESAEYAERLKSLVSLNRESTV